MEWVVKLEARSGWDEVRTIEAGERADFVDVSQSPLAELLPDRCTLEFRRLQAELSARHSYREAAWLLEKFLPCGR